MTHENQVFVVDVVVIDLTWKMVVTSVINQPTCVVPKLNTIAKIRKYKRLHVRHHFFQWPWRSPTHLGLIWIVSSKSVLVFSMINDVSLFFCIQFFRLHNNIAFQCALTFAIERLIVLAGYACSRPPIIIKFHNLHVGDIKGFKGEVTSYHEKD
jgi:hypothetical protein